MHKPQAFLFDAYGTLFDVHSAVRRHAGAIGPEWQLLSDIWRAKQLEYSWVRTLMGAYADFWQLTEQALDFALSKVPSADPNLRAPLLDAYWRLDCYPEVPPVLKALKAALLALETHTAIHRWAASGAGKSPAGTAERGALSSLRD